MSLKLDLPVGPWGPGLRSNFYSGFLLRVEALCPEATDRPRFGAKAW